MHTRVSMIALAVGIALSAFPATAGDMSGLFGNTILCTHANGSVVKVYTKPGGVFMIVRDGQTIQGKWEDDGANVCYTETDPPQPAGSKPVCISSALKHVGDTWPVVDPGGGCTAKLVQGVE